MHTARDLMRRHVIAVSPQASCEKAIDLLIENEVSGLPVVDSAGRVLGIFSEVDQIQRGSIERDSVEHLMSKRVLTVDVHDSWSKVARVFSENAVRRLPVTDSGLLVGIIGLRDVVRFIRETKLNRDSIRFERLSRPTDGDTDAQEAIEEVSTPPRSNYCTPLDERREATRFRRESGTDFAVIVREPEQEILVEVHDESLTGLGILADPKLGLEVGTRVHIVYAGESLEGEVLHVTMQPGGKCLCGLRCRRLLLVEDAHTECRSDH